MEFDALHPLSRDVLGVMALAAVARNQAWVVLMLADPALRAAGSSAPSAKAVRQAFDSLTKDGFLLQDRHRFGFWGVCPEVVARAYASLLDRVPAATLRAALAHGDRYDQRGLGGFRYFPTVGAGLARLRLDAFHGESPGEIAQILDRFPDNGVDVVAQLDRAVTDVVDETLFERLHPVLQAGVVGQSLSRLDAVLSTGVNLSPAFVRARAQAFIDAPGALDISGLCWIVAVDRLLADGVGRRGDGWVETFGTLLEPLCARDGAVAAGSRRPSPEDAAQGRALRQAAQAAALAAQGRWREAEPGFDAALVDLRKATGKRRGLLPAPMDLSYVLTLLAQQTPAHLAKALKFCLGEGGRREPALDHRLGVVALAIQMRQGVVARDPRPFQPYGGARMYMTGGANAASPLDFNRWMMRAWLKEDAAAEPLSAQEADAVRHLKSALEFAGMESRVEMLDAAMQVLAGESSPAWFFVPRGLERWQTALAALRDLGASTETEAAAPSTRIVWVLDTDSRGAVRGLEPREQKRGVRGWGQAKAISLTKLQQGATLTPQDVEVVRAIRTETLGRGLRLDLAQAVGALVGHPHVVFDATAGDFVEIVEGAAELEVVDEGERLRVRLVPGMQVAPDAASPRWGASEAEQKEREALRLVSVWRDSPQRARLVRLTQAQKRVAQLLGPDGLELPRQGAQELQEVLAGLGGHFRIHADEAVTAQAAREIPPEARLRAELTPVGDGLQLRLVAAPFGAEYAATGPRLIPGRGRARVVATLGGESLGVTRELAREREHLESLLDVLPMLPELPPDAPCEWQLDAPDDALALVERMQPHHAIAALDWPQGRPMRVTPGALDDLTLKVRTRKDWLALDGELRIDEELVVSLQQLIGFAGAGRSRFMPLGDGRYLALTQELRERVADLAAVAESRPDKTLDELRLPAVAAPWLQAASEGVRVEHDAAYAKRLRVLDEARATVPALPSTLQVSLRPYQEEGFEWAMRLSAAGLGACLADDMGLGKTLQAIAVLLARAERGPALVVVPTSLIGNWRAEIGRFAPSLRVHVYAEHGARRAQLVESAARHEVVIVSYPMLHIDGEAFATRSWATLVLDEAQAIKNAAAKRSQAVFALKADFRLAMTGTPIENRLGELWSVMRACNPGLLGSVQRFNERFANLIERQDDRLARRTLKRLIAPFVLRRTKAQVLADLPPRTELLLRVQGDEAEQAHYEALRRETLVAAEKSLSGDGAGQAHLNILAGLTRLRRAACDPRLVTPHLSRPGAKVQAFAELAAELVANGHKALVFSQFVDFLALLRQPLDEAGIAYQYLDGSTPAVERTRRVEAFQGGEGDLFLISLKAGGFGLNLTVADYVVIADPWWNPAAEDQASGRAHRIGQQRPVTVYRLVHQGTLEEKILDLHQTKRDLADSLLEGDGGPAAAPPMARELLALMRGDELPEELDS